MKKSLHMRVSGSVHGVGFRKYILRCGESRALTGWVRNRSDETVEIYACGATSVLEDFFMVAKQGSKNSLVAEVNDEWGECDGELTGIFEIKPTK